MDDQPLFALQPLHGPWTSETHDMHVRWSTYRDAPHEPRPTRVEFPGLAVARAVVRAALFNDEPFAQIRGQLAAECAYTCATCGAQVISSVPTERCGPFGCDAA